LKKSDSSTPSVDLGIVISSNAEVVEPVVNDAQLKGLAALARSINELQERTKNRQLRHEDLQPALWLWQISEPTGAYLVFPHWRLVRQQFWDSDTLKSGQ